MEGIKISYEYFGAKFEGRGTLGRLKCICEDNIKMNLKAGRC
jgi:hypothetical protein